MKAFTFNKENVLNIRICKNTQLELFKIYKEFLTLNK
jgi:hypothetical protein